MVTLGSTPRSGTAPADWFEAVASSPRPAVVDYASGPDRVELSGRVLANWAAKTANLLDAEGLGQDAAVAVDLPAGWQPLAVLLGLARAGVQVRFARAGTGTDADLVVSDAPAAWAKAPGELWAVPSGRGEDDAPAHALDFAGEVRVQADRCPLPVPAGDLAGQAEGWADDSTGAGGSAADAAGPPPQRWVRHERGLVVAGHGHRLDRALAGAVLRAWGAGLPVLVVPGTDAAAGDTDRVVAAEGLGERAREGSGGTA